VNLTRSNYGKDNPKSPSIYKEEKTKLKKDRILRSQRDALKFRAKMEKDNGLVIGFSCQYLRIIGKPKKVTNIIVFFKKPLDREFVERRIKDAFIQ